MNDTTHTAYVAEDLIAHKLQRSGLLITKPKFDRDGADLLAFMQVKDGAKFCKIQCKGRSIILNDSNIEILEDYVKGAFVLFLFIDDGFEDHTNLFCFFVDDIKYYWNHVEYKKSSKNKYRLSISKKKFLNTKNKSYLEEYRFDKSKISRIKDIIRKANTGAEIKELLKVIKIQQEIMKLTEEKNDLWSVIKELGYIKKTKKLLKERIDLLEEQKLSLEESMANNKTKKSN